MLELFVPTHRRPSTPGEILLEEVLKPLGVSQLKFAKRIGVGHPRLNEIINGKRAVTPDTAMRFSKALGTSAQIWLNLQTVLDLYDAQHSPAAKAIAKIKPLPELAAAS
jgi:addiction module HigA family antidote